MKDKKNNKHKYLKNGLIIIFTSTLLLIFINSNLFQTTLHWQKKIENEGGTTLLIIKNITLKGGE